MEVLSDLAHLVVFLSSAYSQVIKQSFALTLFSINFISSILMIFVCLCVLFSVPAPLCNVASSAAADAAQTGRGDAERSLPLSQHQTGLQSGLCVLTAGSRLHQVCCIYTFEQTPPPLLSEISHAISMFVFAGNSFPVTHSRSSQSTAMKSGSASSPTTALNSPPARRTQLSSSGRWSR